MTFGHLMPLALESVSHDANNITNGTIAFHRLRQLKKVLCDYFYHVMPLALVSCDTATLLSASFDVDIIDGSPVLLRQEDLNKLQHDFLVM